MTTVEFGEGGEDGVEKGRGRWGGQGGGEHMVGRAERRTWMTEVEF